MIAVRVLAGDNNGGPHTEVTYDLDRDVESLTDEEIRDFRVAVARTHHRAFGSPPETMIVTVDEQPDDAASHGDLGRDA